MKDNYGDKISVTATTEGTVDIMFSEQAGGSRNHASMDLSLDLAREFVDEINKAINTLEGK